MRICHVWVKSRLAYEDGIDGKWGAEAFPHVTVSHAPRWLALPGCAGITTELTNAFVDFRLFA